MAKTKKEEQFQILEADQAVKNWHRYLELQVTLFAETEFELFQKYGFSSVSSSVLDLGCGPGLYARALRAWNPNIQVVAADTNPALISEFKNVLAKKPDSGIQILEWTAGTTQAPDEARKCKFVILRYVLQHNHDPVKVLRALKKQLAPGAIIFIVEEDDGLYQFEPSFPAFEKLILVWRKWAKAFKADRLIGRKVSGMVPKAGLELLDLQVLCHTPHRHGIETFLEYFKLSFNVVSSTTPKILSKKEAIQLERGFKEYSKKFGKRCFLYYPQVITVARVPS